MTTDERYEWLLARQTAIGSSDAPNLCGVGFQSAADVYRSKTEPVTLSDVEGTGILRRGQILEPLVAAEYEAVVGVPLVRAKWLRSPERPWQASSPDFMHAENPRRKVETKTVAGFGFDWGMSGTDDFPEGYRVQCQHQMGVEGLDTIDLAALDIITWELRVFKLEFNPDFFAWLCDLEKQAWDMIEARTPIGPEWEQQWKADAMLLIDNDARIELPESTIPILERRARLKEIQDEAEEAYKSLTAELYSRLGTNAKGVCGDWSVSQWPIKPYTRPACEIAAGRSLRATLRKAGAASKERNTKKGKVFK